MDETEAIEIQIEKGEYKKKYAYIDLKKNKRAIKINTGLYSAELTGVTVRLFDYHGVELCREEFDL